MVTFAIAVVILLSIAFLLALVPWMTPFWGWLETQTQPIKSMFAAVAIVAMIATISVAPKAYAIVVGTTLGWALKGGIVA